MHKLLVVILLLLSLGGICQTKKKAANESSFNLKTRESNRNKAKELLEKATSLELHVFNDSAFFVIQQALRLDSTNGEICQAALRIAVKMNSADVPQLFNKCLQYPSKSCYSILEAKKQLGYYYYDNNKLDSAIQVFSIADNLASSCKNDTDRFNAAVTYLFIQIALAKTLFKQHRPDSAEFLIQHTLPVIDDLGKSLNNTIQFNYYKMHVRLAEAYAVNKDYKQCVFYQNKAAEVLQRMKENNPYELEVTYYDLGNYLVNLKMFREGIDKYLLGLNTLNSWEKEHQQIAGELYYQLGISYFSLNSYDTAKQYFLVGQNVLKAAKAPPFFIDESEYILSKINGIQISQLYPTASNLYDSVLSQFVSLYPLLNLTEQQLFSRLVIQYSNKPSDTYTPSQNASADSFYIQLPYKLFVRLWDDYQIFAISLFKKIDNRFPLRKYHGILYDCANLTGVNAKTFLGLDSIESRMVEKTFDVKRHYSDIQMCILFLLLHEFAHIVYDNKSANDSLKSELDDFQKSLAEQQFCDAWAFNLLIKGFRREHMSIQNDVLLSAVRESVDVILAPSEAQSFYLNGVSPRIARDINLLRITRDSLCAIESSADNICLEIYDQIDILKEESQQLESRKLFMTFHKEHVDGIDYIVECADIIKKKVYQKQSDSCQKLSRTAMRKFLFQSGAGLSYASTLFYLADSYCFGNWGIEQDLKKGLSLYCNIALQDSTSDLFIGQIMFDHDKEHFNNLREHAALIAAIIYEYGYKDAKMAMYYYNIAGSFSKIAPRRFYENKKSAFATQTETK